MAPTNEQIHVATVIRLNVTTTALEMAAHDLDELVRDSDATGERLNDYQCTLAYVRTAIEIARGLRTDVPAELREGSTSAIMHDPGALERFLQFGRG